MEALFPTDEDVLRRVPCVLETVDVVFSREGKGWLEDGSVEGWCVEEDVEDRGVEEDMLLP